MALFLLCSQQEVQLGVCSYLRHFILHLIACWQISFHLASNLLYHFGMNNTSLLHLGLDKG